MKARLARIANDKDCIEEATALKNWQRLVTVAGSMNIGFLQAAAPEDLESALKILVPEVPEFPVKYQHALLGKRLGLLLEKQAYKEAIMLADPFGTDDTFDPLNPTMRGVQDKPGPKLRIFEVVVFQKTLLPMLHGGAASCEQTVQVAKECLSMYENVDLVELDARLAATHSELVSIWRCLVALGTDTLDRSYEDLCLAKGAGDEFTHDKGIKAWKEWPQH